MAKNTIGEKEIKTKWPVVTGTELIDKHEGRVKNLVAEESLVNAKDKVGL